MSPEIKISPEEEKEMMDMLMKRLKMSPEFVEARNKLKFGKTVAEKLEALNIERRIILRGGGPEAVEKQHKRGRLTARERVEVTGSLVDTSLVTSVPVCMERPRSK